jgi:hypothetical protein
MKSTVTQTSVFLGLLLISLSYTVKADSILVPRLGYTSVEAKRIYLNLPMLEGQRADKSETSGRHFNWNPLAHGHKNATKPEDTLADQFKSDKGEKEDRFYRQKISNARHILADSHKAVSGDLYLYNIKYDKLVTQSPPKIQGGSRPYSDFNSPIPEGLYDLAVEGSGHRSSQPLLVSDSIYWEAMAPMLQGFAKTHCPVISTTSYIINNCFENVVQSELSPDRTHVIKGGWYEASQSQSGQAGVIKNAVNIANQTQLLLNLYDLNPESMKYLLLQGLGYQASSMPDILDEALWGLNFLLSARTAEGAVFAGITNENAVLKALPPSAEATGRAVMALANASRLYQKVDLGLSVKYYRAAEKSWSYARQHVEQMTPETQLLALTALKQVSPEASVSAEYSQIKQAITSIQPDTALYLGKPNLSGLSLSEVSDLNNIPLKQANALTSPMAQMLLDNPKAKQSIRFWMEDLYGFEEIPMARDKKLEVSQGWLDPVQWLASAATKAMNRMDNKLNNRTIFTMEKPVTPEKMKEVEAKQKIVYTRMQKGFDRVTTLTGQDKLQTAYALGLLNESVAFDMAKFEEQARAKNKFQFEETYKGPQGYYPKGTSRLE